MLAVDPSLVSRDPAVVSAYVEDPLVHHGKLPARTVAETRGGRGVSRTARPARSPIPTLIVYGTADRLCPPSGSLMLDERIGSADKTLRPTTGLYHEILNEPERDAVLDDLCCAWLSARVAVRR